MELYSIIEVNQEESALCRSELEMDRGLYETSSDEFRNSISSDS